MEEKPLYAESFDFYANIKDEENSKNCEAFIMLTLFFSGTGNTKYVANRFSEMMNCDCYTIEDDVDFTGLIKSQNRICVCYPVYGSRLPRIFKTFIQNHKGLFKGKELIVIATQLIASGDGARAFTDLFPPKYINVIYAEHINMPNNVCNFKLLPLKNGEQNRNKLKKANAKLIKMCENIQNGRIVRRGFNPFSRLLGLSQGAFEEKINAQGKKSVRIDDSCIVCNLCVNICPMKNLKLVSGKIEHNEDCTLCYRCVNRCPQKSITTLFHGKPKTQYHGV